LIVQANRLRFAAPIVPRAKVYLADEINKSSRLNKISGDPVVQLRSRPEGTELPAILRVRQRIIGSVGVVGRRGAASVRAALILQCLQLSKRARRGECRYQMALYVYLADFLPKRVRANG